jgi:prepilin-type N-terminal cleavage/methylation domain-containing protein
MHRNKNHGFTLIELLVVIAIIGVLSAVILSSLRTARSKGDDVAIESDLGTIKTQSQLYYSENDDVYGTALASGTTGTVLAYSANNENLFVGDVTVNAAVNHALSVASAAGTYAIGQDGASYAIAIPLKSDPTTSWCIDSGGKSTSENSATPNLGGGSSADATCP